MQQQVKIVNNMVEKLKQALPSDDLKNLVSSLQETTKNNFALNQEFT